MARYRQVQILTICPKCNAGVPVNGPHAKLTCTNCLDGVTIEPEDWLALLQDADDDAVSESTIDSRHTIHLRSAEPACPGCETPLDVESLEPGSRKSWSCPKCGRELNTFPPPAWLANLPRPEYFTDVMPQVAQIYCAEDPETPTGTEHTAATPEAAKPVVMRCPECGGSLKITTQQERTVVCEYCKANVFLPDALWQRLRPAKKTVSWFIRFEGQSKKEREEATRRQAALEKQQNQRRLVWGVLIVGVVAGVAALIVHWLN